MSENMSEAQAMRIAAIQRGDASPSVVADLDMLQFLHPIHQPYAPIPQSLVATAYNPEQGYSNIDAKGIFFLRLCTQRQELKGRIGTPPVAMTTDQDLEYTAVQGIQYVKVMRSHKGFERKEITTSRQESSIRTPESPKHRGFRLFGRKKEAQPE